MARWPAAPAGCLAAGSITLPSILATSSWFRRKLSAVRLNGRPHWNPRSSHTRLELRFKLREVSRIFGILMLSVRSVALGIGLVGLLSLAAVAQVRISGAN